MVSLRRREQVYDVPCRFGPRPHADGDCPLSPMTLSVQPRSELARPYLGAAAPEVIAGQVDVLPARRRQVSHV